MKQKTVIVLTGRNGVGKDYIANIIQKMFVGSTRSAFGDAVKNTCIELFPWIPRENFYDNALKDVVFVHPLNVGNHTPRNIIHHISASTQQIDVGIFTRKTVSEISEKVFGSDTTLHVVTDMRIQREFDYLVSLRKTHGVRILFVKVLGGQEATTAARDVFEQCVDNFSDFDVCFHNDKQQPNSVIEDMLKGLLE